MLVTIEEAIGAGDLVRIISSESRPLLIATLEGMLRQAIAEHQLAMRLNDPVCAAITRSAVVKLRGLLRAAKLASKQS